MYTKIQSNSNKPIMFSGSDEQRKRFITRLEASKNKLFDKFSEIEDRTHDL